MQSILERPREQRVREYQYRCAQSMVFGLPVVGLQVWGNSLGGPEADRWVGALQALLAGWVVYVGAAGMLFEGALLLLERRRATGDFVVALLAVVAYLASLASVVALVVAGRALFRPVWFHWVVVALAAWTGFRWWRISS
ncbi:MAG: hypothetical protein ACREIT_09840 [Tepidisphaeraceae bacterium]